MIISRGAYNFIGPRADESAKYFDTVISHGYTGDLLYLAWESAHKFGQQMTGPRIASYRDGVAMGERALEAAEYIDGKREEIFSNLPQLNRSKLLKEAMSEHFRSAEQEYGVKFRKL